MTLTSFLRTAVRILDEAGVPYMITGSLAAAYYGVARATQDVDMVIEVEGDEIDRVVQGLLDAGFYVDRGTALEAQRTRGQFNAIDPESGWKVDLIVRKERPYSKTEFERRQRVSFLGVEAAVASLEDLLIAKLEWSRLADSALQRRDVTQLLERLGTPLDRSYLEKWVAELGLGAEWAEALRELPDTPGEGDE